METPAGKPVSAGQKLLVVLTLLLLAAALVVLGWDGWTAYRVVPLQYLAVLPLIGIAYGLSGGDIWTPLLAETAAPGRSQDSQRVLAFRAGLAMTFLASLPFLFIGTTVGGYVRLVATGERAIARCLAKDGAGQKIRYAFSTAAGQRQSEIAVSRHVVESVQVGGTLDIVFDSQRPERNCPRFDGNAVVGFVVVFGAAVLAGVLLMWRSTARN